MKKQTLTALLLFLFINIITSQNKDAEIVKYETRYTISSQNILTENISITIQINNRTGEKLTKIKIPYSENSPVVALNAQLEDLTGNTIRKLKKKEIVDRSDISNSALYEDDYIKTFTLKHNTYPYRISYNYKIMHKSFFYITSWNPIIDYKTSTKNATLELTIPDKYDINFNSKNIENPKVDKYEGTTKYSWSSNYTYQSKKNIYSPGRNKTISSVKIVPSNFIYGELGNQDSWKNFGNWVSALNEGLDVLPNDEKQKIDKILLGKNSKEEIISALYTYMQENTRYINVAVDIGGFKPYSATYVSENKYGDCKALSNYMKSILAYAGIESYYTLINAGDKIRKIDTSFTTSQFNHAILFVPGEKDTTWLECTSKYNPTGYLGTFTQNRNALIIEKDNSKLIKTPELKINEVENKRTVFFNLNQNKSVTAEINFNLKGDSYELFEHFTKTLSKDQKDKYIHDLIPFYNYNLEKWEINKDNNEFASISLYAKLALNNYIKTYDSIKYVSLFPTEIPSFEKPSKRSKGVQIDYPINIKDSLVYYNIKGYDIEIIKDTTHQSVYGNYNIRSKIIPEGLLITKQFILFPNEIKLENYKAFYEFIKTVKTIERKSPIVYTKK